ncbi:MAG: hypothetical protein IPJ07_22650 [Acidobacteria bacterium]|nr:hypothetical protein [Acidobacteriota bacterium]
MTSDLDLPAETTLEMKKNGVKILPGESNLHTFAELTLKSVDVVVYGGKAGNFMEQFITRSVSASEDVH